jgi:hypothetical protein
MMGTQSGGNGQDGVRLGTVGVGDKRVGEAVRVGSPGFGVGMMIVGVFVDVGDAVGRMAWEIPNLSSAKEIAKLPMMMMMETRAARNPEVNSRRLFMRPFPMKKPYLVLGFDLALNSCLRVG